MKGIHAYLFEGPKRSEAVILSEAKFASYIPPHLKDGAVRDLFGNDVKPGEAFKGMTMFISAPIDPATLEHDLLQK